MEVAFSSMSQLVEAHFSRKLPVAKDKTGNIYIIRPIPVPPWVFNPDHVDILDFIGRVSVYKMMCNFCNNFCMYYRVARATCGLEQ